MAVRAHDRCFRGARPLRQPSGVRDRRGPGKSYIFFTPTTLLSPNRPRRPRRPSPPRLLPPRRVGPQLPSPRRRPRRQSGRSTRPATISSPCQAGTAASSGGRCAWHGAHALRCPSLATRGRGHVTPSPDRPNPNTHQIGAKSWQYCCKHGKVNSMCKDCGGSQICEHKRVRTTCRECGGSAICAPHGGWL